MTKINNFRGDLGDISAKKTSLSALNMTLLRAALTSRHVCVLLLQWRAPEASIGRLQTHTWDRRSLDPRGIQWTRRSSRGWSAAFVRALCPQSLAIFQDHCKHVLPVSDRWECAYFPLQVSLPPAQ